MKPKKGTKQQQTWPDKKKPQTQMEPENDQAVDRISKTRLRTNVKPVI